MQPQTGTNVQETVGSYPLTADAPVRMADAPRPLVDVAEIEDVVRRALAKRSALPPYPELCVIHASLLHHIERLFPLAASQVDRLWRGSKEWSLKRTYLSQVQYQVDEGLGSGLLSASCRVQSLGYTLRFLLENSGLVQEEVVEP
ncbi:DUF6415 family natural product biosynthesis protein [Streptomyces sp. NPDC050610]|uniref:DUF6415 family natural product biosynthesis protein n=1 Tax=Streptomyces sp. NPDC050610 TaxID=3157097 RepID=UPI003439B482